MLEVPLLGAGTVLRLETDAWPMNGHMMAKASTNEYTPARLAR